MGCHDNITATKFPKQSENLNKSVNVCFHYDTSQTLRGTIIRSDTEEPGIMIINLEDGRTVLSTECMYSYPKE